MKNVSKLALFVAAGMLSAGANASTIVLGAEGTSLSLEGGVSSDFIVSETVDSSLDSNSDNQSDLEGEVALGVTAERSFGNFDGYAEFGFTFASQEDGGSTQESDGAVAGFKGNFGQIEIGDSDSVYEDEIHDAVDIWEQASLTNADVGVDGDNMITYYSPSTNGFSFNLQAAVQDEKEGTTGTTDTSFNASSVYDFGAGAIHVGYNEVDFTGDSDVLGIAAIFEVGVAEISLVHEMESLNDVDTDYTGLTVAAGYGPGDIYAGFQSVSPDAAGSEDLSQYGVGINAEIADGLSTYAEYGNLDGQADADQDTVMAVGFAFDF
jgi:predicted porin